MFQPNQPAVNPNNLTSFLLIFTTFFSLLFVSGSWLLLDDIYLFALRKYVEPEINREFGFTSREGKIIFNDHQNTVFMIETVEKGSLMDRAGFRPKDVPILNVGCRFFYLNRSNESVFYGILRAMGDGQRQDFEVINTDDFAKASKLKQDPFKYKRKLIVKKFPFRPCGQKS